MLEEGRPSRQGLQVEGSFTGWVLEGLQVYQLPGLPLLAVVAVLVAYALRAAVVVFVVSAVLVASAVVVWLSCVSHSSAPCSSPPPPSQT